MRVHFLPSPGASRHPLPKGEGHARNRFPNRESHETRITLGLCLLAWPLYSRSLARHKDKAVKYVPRMKAAA